MRFIKAMALVMVLFLAIGGVAFCGSISGQVVDKVTQEPVEDVLLELYKWNELFQRWEYVGDAYSWDGDFSFSDLDNGTYIVYIRPIFLWRESNFFELKKNYFPQWYDGVLGRRDNADSATKIELTDSEPDKTITVNLEPSPVSVGLSAGDIVRQGTIRYGIAVKNWTPEDLSLKLAVTLRGGDIYSDWDWREFNYPLIKIGLNLSGSEKKSKVLNLNVPAFVPDGKYTIRVEVYPSDKCPWVLYGWSEVWFEKKGTTLSIIKDKKKLREIYLKRIPKVLK